MATKKTTKTATVKAAAKPAAAKKPTAAKKTATVAKTETCACEVAEAPAKKTCAKKAAAPKTSRVTFTVRDEVGSKVFLAGDFNNWDPTAKAMTDKNGNGEYTCCLNLAKGAYQYKFVINGVWCADPENANYEYNDMGTINSVKIVD